MEDFSSWTDDDWFDSDYMDEEDYKSVHGDSAIGDFTWGAGDSMWNTPATDGGWINQTQPGLLSNPTAEESQVLNRIKTDPSYASTMQMLGQQKAAAKHQQSLDRLKSIDVAENNLQYSGWNDMTAPRAEGPISDVHVNYSMPNLQAAQVAHEEEWADTDHFGNPLSTDQFGNYNFDTQQQQYLNAKNSNVFSPDELAAEDVNLWQALGEKDPTLSATEKFWKDRAIKAESPLKGVREFVRGTVGGPAINAYNNMMGVAESTKAYDPNEDVQGQMPGNIGSDIAGIGTGIIEAFSNPLAVAEEVASLASGGLQHVVGDDYAWNLEDKEKAAQFGQSIIDTYGSVEGWKQEFAERPVSTIAMATGAGILGKAVGQGLLKAADPETVDKVMGNIPGLLAEPKKEIITYHGTKHDLKDNKFDIDKVGTGQGAATYGHGIYVAENPDVAKVYKSELSGDRMYSTLDVDGNSVADYMVNDMSQHALNTLFKFEGDVGKTINKLKAKAEKHPFASTRKISEEGVPFIENFVKEHNVTWNPRGKLYEVDLPDKFVETMVDWDKPLSQQSLTIQSIAKQIDPNADLKDTGEVLYNTLTDKLGSKKAASEFLNSKGVPGVKYLDGGSRDTKFVLTPPDETKAGDWMVNNNKNPNQPGKHFDTKQEAEAYLEKAQKGTSNFVAFDDSILTVLKKNGEPVKTKTSTTSNSLPWSMSSKGEGDFYIQRVGPNAGKVSKTRNGPSDIAFSTDQEVLLPDYAYYAVMNLEKQLQSRAHGAAQQAINQKDVDEILTDFFQNQSKGVNAAAPIGALGLTEESMTESMLGTQNVSDAFMHATENISPENISTKEQGLIGTEDMTNEELDEYIKGLLGNIR